jgi:hypothetical protein
MEETLTRYLLAAEHSELPAGIILMEQSRTLMIPYTGTLLKRQYQADYCSP